MARRGRRITLTEAWDLCREIHAEANRARFEARSKESEAMTEYAAVRQTGEWQHQCEGAKMNGYAFRTVASGRWVMEISTVRQCESAVAFPRGATHCPYCGKQFPPIPTDTGEIA